MSLASLPQALRGFLLADSAISTAVGGTRIYAIKLPQGQLLTSLVLSRISGLADHHNQGPSGLARPRYQIDAWAPTAEAASTLADLVKQRIDGYAGAMSWTVGMVTTSVNVQGCFFADRETDDHDPGVNLFRTSRDYFFWFDER